MNIIEDAWGLSGKAPIIPSGGFSIETLTEVTLLWKTESNRSISTMEDAILLEGAERSQVMGSKYKEVTFRDEERHQPSKKAKEKYHEDDIVKMEGANPYERYVCAPGRIV